MASREVRTRLLQRHYPAQSLVHISHADTGQPVFDQSLLVFLLAQAGPRQVGPKYLPLPPQSHCDRKYVAGLLTDLYKA
jgi:hypothetical protein